MGSSQPRLQHIGNDKGAARKRAEIEDRHDLYQRAVQDPESDVDFLLRVYREVHGSSKRPLHFREDFCGTAILCATWVRRHPEATAEGFDIDPECLEWGRVHNVQPLGTAAARVTLHRGDVREKGERPAQIRCAQNFSYQILRERSELLDYFRRVYDETPDDGIFVIDLYGGSEAVDEIEEEREIEDGDFTYVWEQRSFHPGTGRTECFIHFRFDDGSEMREAFRYTWRLYSPPELRDILREAGFGDIRLYFEEFDEDGDGTGHFARDEDGEACEGWLGYMVCAR